MAEDATTTITLPLTTIFTRPSRCSSSWTWAPYIMSGTLCPRLVQEYGPLTADEACLPSGHIREWNPNTAQIYSPGICPDGYTTATTSENEVATTAVCCLENFSFSSGNLGPGCFSSLPSGQVTTVPRPAPPAPVTGPMPMLAEPITIAYNQQVPTTTPALTITLSTLSTSQMLTPTRATTATKTASSTLSDTAISMISPTSSDNTSVNPSPASSSGLLDGEKAGIGVGVACGVLVIIISCAFFIIKRRRAQRSDVGGYPQMAHEADSKPYNPPAELEAPPIVKKRSPVELES